MTNFNTNKEIENDTLGFSRRMIVRLLTIDGEQTATTVLYKLGISPQKTCVLMKQLIDTGIVTSFRGIYGNSSTPVNIYSLKTSYKILYIVWEKYYWKKIRQMVS